MSKRLLTPRDLAHAIGASESSIRRWIDAGEIATARTAGGHRRVALEEAIRYIRRSGAALVQPHALGLDLPRLPRTETLGLDEAQRLFEALRGGDGAAARGMILSWFLSARSLPALFDGPVRAAMHRIGELWQHEPRGILVEHRATQICLGALAELRALIPMPAEHAPVAMGGAVEGDPYLIPTIMAGAVLADAGWHEVNFGSNTPVELLASESAARRARLIWISISFAEISPDLRASIRALARRVAQGQTHVVVGGRCVEAFRIRPSVNLRTVDSMTGLASVAARLR